jgi:DNA-directed RNA polymerase subunit E'
MYLKMRLVDDVRVPPECLGEATYPIIKGLLQKKLEGRIDKALGVIVAIIDVVDVGEGRILFGDGGVYYETTFDALVFRPEMQEIIEGNVVEIVNFGAFVSMGPMDGLLHISQITDDYVSYDEKNARLVGKEKGKSLGEGDSVRARIVTISINENAPRESKIGLTMRQPALGKLEWLEEERKENRSTRDGSERSKGTRPNLHGESL